MIDLKFIKANVELAKKSQIARNSDPNLIDEVINLDNLYLESLSEFEKARAEQKKVGEKIPTASNDEKAGLLEMTKSLKAKVSELSGKVEAMKDKRDEVAYSIENLIEDAPSGGEEDYIVVKEQGKIPHFNFEVKDHLDLGILTDTIDTERGAKVSGSRFYFLKGLGARLEFAIFNLAIKKATENGFVLMNTPTIVRPEVMKGTGFLGKHSDEIYRLREPDDEYLVGTSEVALAGYHTNEILDFKNGPLLYSGYSSCFRREAGSYGKDTRGIIRVHQFNKVEMFVYCPLEDSFEMHKKLLKMEEDMIKDMEIPYRVIDTAAGDLGSSAARKFDCEGWLPSQNRYLELTSTSNCTTFQARRLNIRHSQGDKNEVCATLNGTLATTRWIVSIFENHQNEDGSINVPKALQPYLGTDIIPVI